MGKLMDEKKIKKVLNVESFDEIDKKRASKFVSMLSKIDKNVAIKALEESVKIANAMKDTLVEYYKSINNVVKSADDSIKSVNENYKEIIKALIEKLDDKDISSKDSKYIIDKIIEFQKMQNAENAEHRNFLLKALGVIAVFVLGIFGIKKKFDNKI